GRDSAAETAAGRSASSISGTGPDGAAISRSGAGDPGGDTQGRWDRTRRRYRRGSIGRAVSKVGLRADLSGSARWHFRLRSSSRQNRDIGTGGGEDAAPTFAGRGANLDRSERARCGYRDSNASIRNRRRNRTPDPMPGLIGNLESGTTR